MMPRTLCALAWLALAPACASVNRQAFTPLVQRGQELVTALDSKPSLPAFRPLRQGFNRALTDVRPTLQSSAEKSILRQFETVDERLGEMETVWTGLVEREEGRIPIAQPLAGALKTRYDLAVNSNDPPSVYAEEALSALRDDIKQRLSGATEAVAK